MNYAINDVYSSIQGEGCQTGVPMVIVRMHGCDVGCSFCDTKETWRFKQEDLVGTLLEALGQNPRFVRASIFDLVSYIVGNLAGPKWILITGGEPAQQNLGPLVDSLHAHGYRVAIETSGTACGHVNAGIDWICVSPKIDMPGGLKIQPAAVAWADEIKFIIGKESDFAKLESFLTNNPVKESAEVCLQPLSQSEKATQLCVAKALQMGWRVSIQTHKFLNLP